MSVRTGNHGTLAQHGVPLSKAGFEVIWIPKGTKGPVAEKWQTMTTNETVVAAWAANGKADANVGIRTTNTPAVDIDLLDAELVGALEAWCLHHIGAAPTRVGRAPKTLLVYATDKPFRKMQITFRPPDFKAGDKPQKIEVLGEGQQFVAYGLHPDTKKNYEWTSKVGLSDMETYELTTITPAQVEALFDEAIRLTKVKGWKVTQRTGGVQAAEPSDDDDLQGLENYQPTGTFTEEELTDALAYLDPDAGYDRWLQIGQGLHHQYEAGEDGFAIWEKWSERSMEYDYDELRAKWESFSDQRNGRVVTAKSIIHWAKEGKTKVAGDLFDAVLAEIDACTTLVELTGPVLMKSIGKQIDGTMVDTMIEKIKQKAKELGSKLSTPTIRKTLKTAMRKDRSKSLPAWCANYVYVAQDDKFYDQIKHRRISDRGFNAMHNRRIATDGEEAPNATRFALDTLELTVVDTYTYMPGHLPIIDVDGASSVNTYNDSGVPAVPSLLSDEEETAIKLVQEHFAMVFPDLREREILLSYLAYTVQHLDQRVTWAPLIYGGEGAGKTFFFEMMRNVLGASNAMPVSAKQLQQQFTGWAEGNRLVVFEEIRLTGHNRYDVLESLKPLITNQTVDVRRMQTDTYSVHNVTNYLLFTNYEDALPISDGDRRYFILATSLISKDEIVAFNNAHPKYFTRLFYAINAHAGAILGWLQELPMHPEFRQKGNAPDTVSKRIMKESSHDDEFDDLDELIRTSKQWDVCGELLSLTSLKARVSLLVFDDEDQSSAVMPAPVRVKTVMRQLGFSYVGRARPGRAGKQGTATPQHRYYSRTPGQIKKAGGLQKYVLDRLDADDFSFN